MTYDLLSHNAPPMPDRLPGYVKHAISKVPDYMRPAAANALFPPSAAQMHDVTFRFVDNVLHEPGSKMEGCIAPSGFGKGYLDAMIEAIIRNLRQHDSESQKKLAEYARIYKSKGQSKDKPDRPTDAAILVPEPDMTNPALVQLLQDAEREGNRSLYTTMAEVDLLDQCCGGHKKVTKVIRLNYDTKRYGAQRATVDGITGNPFLRWKFNFSCVEEKALSFFKSSMLDGTLGRIGISYLPKDSKRKRGIPRQGDYDEPYMQKLEEYLIRLRAATGEIRVPKINKLIDRLDKEMDEIADLSDDDFFETMSHRSVGIAWLKGCLLYVAEGYKWSKEIADFVEWSLYYDLWSKIAVFAPQMKNSGGRIIIDQRKYGPANMLDMLSDSFTEDMLSQLRQSRGMSVYCANQLNTWQCRGYITYDESTKLYTKTPDYLAKHGKL